MKKFMDELINSAVDFNSRTAIRSEQIELRNKKHASMFATKHSVDQEMAIQSINATKSIARKYERKSS